MSIVMIIMIISSIIHDTDNENQVLLWLGLMIMVIIILMAPTNTAILISFDNHIAMI